MNKINTNQLFTLFLIVLSTSISSAASTDAIANQQFIITALYTLVTFIAIFLGVCLIIAGIVKLKHRADNPNDVKSFPAAIITTVLVGSLMINYNSSISVAISSFYGSSADMCFVLDASAGAGDYVGSNCWDASNSEVLADIKDKVSSMDEENKINENAKTLVAMFQLVGLIYFLKGLYSLKLASEGNSKETHGKALVVIIASALIIDLPNTIELIRSTLEYLGYTV